MSEGLLTLPVELILLVTSHLEFAYDINALCLTSKSLHKRLNSILYKLSVTQRNGGYTLEWAAITGSASACRLILKAGAPPDACGEVDWQPFALAAIHGNSHIIELLHEHGIDPCSTNNDWKNRLDDEEDLLDGSEGHPLSMAASNGHISVVHLLLEYGVPPDLPTGNNEKQTALHLAAEKGHLEVVRLLTDVESPINAQDGLGYTPLAFAAREGHLDVVQFLLSRGADPNIEGKDNGTSLCQASRSGNIEIVRCLLDHGATPNPSYPDGRKPLFQLSRAAVRGHSDIFNLLLSRFDYIKSSTEPYQQAILLCVAAITGQTTLLTDLLTKHNYEPNLQVTDLRIFFPEHDLTNMPKNALTWAIERNQTNAISILLSHGANIASVSTERTSGIATYSSIQKDNSLVVRAIINGHKGAVEALIDHGANPNHPPAQALFAAVTNSPIFSLLLHMHNADPTIEFANKSLLAQVLVSGNVETLRILLDHLRIAELVSDSIPAGSSLRPRQSSLFHLALQGGEEVLRLLLDRGLVIPPKNLCDRTAGECLSIAVEHERISLMRLLLDMGFDFKAGDNVGYLLYRAAKAKKDPDALLDFFLQTGCSVDETRGSRPTALLLAAEDGHEGAMRRLLHRGANPLATEYSGTVLAKAARTGNVAAVKLVLAALNKRDLDLRAVERILKQAEERRMEGEESRENQYPAIPRRNFFEVRKALRRFYWCRRHPVPT